MDTKTNGKKTRKTMKLNKIITGCALAAGLMAFAAQSQAGTVIGNSLYSAFNAKATVTYVDNGKYKKMSFSNKDILTASGEDFKGAKLAMGPGQDVYVIYKDGKDWFVDYDLTEGGYVDVTLNDYVSTYNETKNTQKYTYKGYSDFYFYNYTDYGYDALNLYGVYSDSYNYQYNNKNYDYIYNYSLTANGLAGETFSYDGESYYDYLPASGSVSASGSGKIVD